MFGETGNYTNPVKLCGLMSFYGDQIIRFINISFATCISRCYANVSLKLWQSINYVILLYWILSVRPCARPDVSEAYAWAINIRISGTSSRRTRERQCIRNIYRSRGAKMWFRKSNYNSISERGTNRENSAASRREWRSCFRTWRSIIFNTRRLQNIMRGAHINTRIITVGCFISRNYNFTSVFTYCHVLGETSIDVTL